MTTQNFAGASAWREIGAGGLVLLLGTWAEYAGVKERQLQARGDNPKWRGFCPSCGSERLEVDYKPHRQTGTPTVLVHCWTCQAGLTEVCHILGLMVRAVLYNTGRIPPGFKTGGAAGGKRERERRIRDQDLPGVSQGDALRYLRARGLSERTIEEANLRYGSRRGLGAFFLPVERDASGWVVRFRFWPEVGRDGRKYRGMDGWPSALYPVGLEEARPNRRKRKLDGPLVLLAGEFDALLGRQVGTYAYSTTTGCSLTERLIPQVGALAEGRPGVAVLYDVGESMERTLGRLRAARIPAWPVRLRLLVPDAPRGFDLTDYLVKHQGSVPDLRAFMERERRRVGPAVG